MQVPRNRNEKEKQIVEKLTYLAFGKAGVVGSGWNFLKLEMAEDVEIRIFLVHCTLSHHLGLIVNLRVMSSDEPRCFIRSLLYSCHCFVVDTCMHDLEY